MSIIKAFLMIITSMLLISCHSRKTRQQSVELITDPLKQKELFNNLLEVSGGLSEKLHNDSLAFLILPVHASCPFCRKKTIDSIVRNRERIDDRHFVIISANGGRKTISAFFKEQGYELPVVNGNFLLDSTNLAFKYELYKEKPTMYYTFRARAYKKVAALPETVRRDLRAFFHPSPDDNKQVHK